MRLCIVYRMLNYSGNDFFNIISYQANERKIVWIDIEALQSAIMAGNEHGLESCMPPCNSGSAERGLQVACGDEA